MRTSGRSSSSWSTSLDLDVAVRATRAGPVEAVVAGEGPTVLLVHGTPGSWRQCVPVAEDLAEEFHVVLPSRPGYGLTPVSTARTYEQQADALAALLDALRIEKCAVVGVSGGGPIAAAMAARHHERVTALVMACAMAAHLVTVPTASRLIRIPVLPTFISPALRAARSRRIRRPEAVDEWLRTDLTPDELARAQRDPRVREDLVRHQLSHLAAPPGIAGLRNDLVQIEHARRAGAGSYEGVACPVLLMYGTADTVIPLSHAEFYESVLPSPRLVRYEDAGHLFVLTRRSEASAEIADLARSAAQG